MKGGGANNHYQLIFVQIIWVGYMSLTLRWIQFKAILLK